jgi:two-component system phosphate regulon sensor histidine kinase PhoR
VIALHDITTLKDLNRLKTHMIQMASHDLKNPIGVLRGYLEIIQGDIKGGEPPAAQLLESMARTIQRMETLVATLLDVQRAEQNAPLDRALIDPQALLQAVLDDTTPGINLRGHTLRVNIQGEMAEFQADFARLREAMNNLVENAVKYTSPGGQVTITAAMSDERFSFSVKDTGLGIPEAAQADLFQPYYRAHQPGAEDVPGTGVGLSLVKEVVERHGGQVWFTSTMGVGSTFGFWVPLLAE